MEKSGQGPDPKPKRARRIPGLAWMAAAGLIVLTLDQLTKWWVVANIAGKGTVPIIDGFARLRYTENRGAAFGFFQGWTGLLSIAAIAVVAAIFYSASKLGHGNRLGLITLGLITGGALGNLTDRLRLGYVVDFMDVHGLRIEIDHTPYTFPVFNVADSGITIGAILLIASVIFGGHSEEGAEQATPTPADSPEQLTTLPVRRKTGDGAVPKEPTAAGWAGLAVLLAGLFLMALRIARERS